MRIPEDDLLGHIEGHAYHGYYTRREFLAVMAAAAGGGALLSACTHPIANTLSKVTSTPSSVAAIETRWPIKRVLYVMVENRSYDHIFGRYARANGATSGMRAGQQVPLIHAPQWLPSDLPHDYQSAVIDLSAGAMDGFAEQISPYVNSEYAYSQLGQADVPNYWTWADNYVLCDNFFASSLGPSYANHLFFIAGTSGGSFDNPENIGLRKVGNTWVKSWGCDAVGDGVFVFVRDEHGDLTKHATCFDFETVPDQLSSKGIDWAYYAANPTEPGYIWNALTSIDHIFHTDVFREHARPVDHLVADIKGNKLPSVTWVTPRFQLSDHPPWNTAATHNWLTEIVNAVMTGPNWNDTAIFLTWDEWGGLYDHVSPPVIDPVGLGFRVPMILISPYTYTGVVDTNQGEFSSPLRFIVDNWGLSYLTDRIKNTHNFEHVFNFAGKPRPPMPLKPRPVYGNPYVYPRNFPGWLPGTVPTSSPL